MLIEIDHYDNVKNWPLRYFTAKEVADTRTGEVSLWLPFGLKMDRLRELHGRPITINSWFRTAAHDKAIGGKGGHIGGWAADTDTADRHHFLKCAFIVGFAGVGIAKTFIHLDDSQKFIEQGKRPALWTYS